MKTITLSLHDQAVEIRFPESLEAEVRRLFPERVASPTSQPTLITIHERDEGRFSIYAGSEEVASRLPRADLPIWIMEEAVRVLITPLRTAVALHAGAVGWLRSAVLLAGASGSGKSSLVAWLIDKGFKYMTDELVILKEDNTVLGFPRALVLKHRAAEQAQAFSIFEHLNPIRSGGSMICLPSEATFDTNPRSCGLIIFPQYRHGASLRMEVKTLAQAGARLVECNLNARNFADGGFEAIARFARLVPAIGLEFGTFAQLEGTLDTIIRRTIEDQLTRDQIGRHAFDVTTRV